MSTHRDRHRPTLSWPTSTVVLLFLGASNVAAQVCLAPANEEFHGRVLRSVGFGTTPDLLNQLSASGPNAWVLQQLDPDGIDESANQSLNDVLAGIHLPTSQGDPEATVEQLADWLVARALFGDKQLETKLVAFWRNHLTTSVFDVSSKVGDLGVSVWFQYQELEAFRQKALGPFEELLRTSATSPAMLFYLDNYVNTASGPNENYGRELLELHTVGADNGYTSSDVALVAAAFTGWGVQAVLPGDVGDPNATPIDCDYLYKSYFAGDVDADGYVDVQDEAIILAHFGVQGQPGNYLHRYDIYPPPAVFCNPMTGLPSAYGDGVIDAQDLGVVQANSGQVWWLYSFVFDPSTHDYSPKVIFGSGIPQVTLPVFPQGDPLAYKEGMVLLDHLAASPQCAEFMTQKLFNLFVSDEDLATTDPALLASLKNVWLSTGGNVARFLRFLFANTTLASSYDMDYDKVRDGFERAVALTRALGGTPPTNQTIAWQSVDGVRDWMDSHFAYALFRYPAPDGFAEDGKEVTDTNATLFSWRFFQQTWDTSSPNTPAMPVFDFDLDGQMLAAGVNLDDPDQVTCYLLRRLVPGNYTAADHALVKDFLTTTPSGAPFTLDYANNFAGWSRAVHKTAAFAACLPQFLLQ